MFHVALSPAREGREMLQARRRKRQKAQEVEYKSQVLPSLCPCCTSRPATETLHRRLYMGAGRREGEMQEKEQNVAGSKAKVERRHRWGRNA